MFEILLAIVENLGLHSSNLKSFVQIKLLAWFLILYIFPWLLIVMNIVAGRGLNLDEFLKTVLVTENIARLIHFCLMKLKIMKLHSQIVQDFSGEDFKKTLDLVERKMRKVLKCIFFIAASAVIAGFGTIALAEDLIVPLFKPDTWEYNGIVRLIYSVFQCSCTFYGYVVLWTFNLFVIYFLVYFQEISKFIGVKFAEMKSNKDLKICTKLHTNLVK